MGKDERRKTEIEGLFCIQRLGFVDLGRYSNRAKGYESARVNGIVKLSSAVMIGMDINPLPQAVKTWLAMEDPFERAIELSAIEKLEASSSVQKIMLYETDRFPGRNSQGWSLGPRGTRETADYTRG